MNFPSIDIQGSILSSDLLAKIRSEQATFQQGKDFKADFSNAKLKDEISFAWQEAKGQWTIFKSKIARLKEGETGTTETRNFWISPLLTNLGYNLVFNRTAEELNGKSFPIGYRDSNLDNFPVYVGGYFESLDKRPENKQLRVSPHALMQEYLNYSEHLYGIVTNGHQLRLLRDASRITRLSYVEFNLEKMMEEDLYSDFVIFYRSLHSSRMPEKIDAGAESIIEKYHQEGLEAGSTIRSELGKAVKNAIRNLANSFINHPNNTELREAVADGNINADEYYRHQLRIIYRLLFLFVIEERNLVYADSKTPETKRFNHIYFNYYSLLRLRKLAKKLLPPEANRHYDLWQSLVNTFSLFEKKEIGEKLGIMALQGELFGYDAICGSNYDLHQCFLSNSDLLCIIKSLSYFENDKGVLIAVNYGGLDVEEFGSVYEGLLELKLTITKIEGTELYACSFDSSNERGKSGSHYTPEELVQPLIKHSLEYLIEDRIKPYHQKKQSKENTIQSLLSLKIADVACGSGHILLSAARRLALEIARVQSDEEQPNPLSIRKAMKDVVRNCIYGVDKNPLAVELCKIALWLEAYNPGEPLNFLDHHIKCGDAIVGLAHREELEKGIADEAFKAHSEVEKKSLVPSNDARVLEITLASYLLRRNKQERKEYENRAIQLKAQFEESTGNIVHEALLEYKQFNQMPETTPEEVIIKQKAYNRFLSGQGNTFLKNMADVQVAQFFIPKTEENKDLLITDFEYRQILGGHKGWQGQKAAKAYAIAHEKKFFHWFLEFPEVFQQGGFDCVLGNPPFLGGQKLSGNYGDDFLECIKYGFAPIGAVDLVTYFFRRIFNLIKPNGYQSLISTNTIAQGRAREDGLDIIVKNGGTINHAVRSMKWPGLAAVEVALVTLTKQDWKKDFFLNGKIVKTITAYLDDTETKDVPFMLLQNKGKSFQGTMILGNGFIIEENLATELISKDINNQKIIFKYLNGDDFSNHPSQKPSRWVINFFDWEEDFCRQNYPEAFSIVEKRVKQDRQKNNREQYRKLWWIYGERRVALYTELIGKNRVIALPSVSKHVALGFTPTNYVFMNKITIITFDKYHYFTILGSIVHNIWAWKNCSTIGSAGLNYSPTDAFETFPVPKNLSVITQDCLANIGENFDKHRNELMLLLNLGLTKTYNLFHFQFLTSVDIEAISKQSQEVSKQAQLDIFKLRELHKQMDEAVLDAYGWSDIQLKHDFYEVDYLPENDRVRYTIHPDARKEILKRLLALNHKIYEEEIREGLHKEEAVKKFFEQKGIPVPQEVLLKMAEVKKAKKVKVGKKIKKKGDAVNDGESVYKQPGLFGDRNLFSGGEE